MPVSKRSHGQSHQGSEPVDALSSQKSQHLSPLSEFAQILDFQPLVSCFFIIAIGTQRNKLGSGDGVEEGFLEDKLLGLGCCGDLNWIP